MDIYAYAEEMNYACDYLDNASGRIYAITEAKDHDGKIPVYEMDGFLQSHFIGYAVRKDGGYDE